MTLAAIRSVTNAIIAKAARHRRQERPRVSIVLSWPGYWWRVGWLSE